MKILFNNDYAEGAHPLILQKLQETNDEQTPGYGTDAHCETARKLVRQLCCDETLDVQFFAGGTQANLTVIAAALAPHQGVIAASSGHITTHESGAIEATGHQVIALHSTDGKITAAQVQQTHQAHWADETREHTVQPAMVYISQPTECGTLYTKAELQALSETCRQLDLLLYMDGARLGYALASYKNDLYLPDYASLCDAFYIGGTKVGALFGEAVVLKAPRLQKDFRYILKQRGAMLAKGRILGIQFEVLLQGGLYQKIAQHANEQAMRLRTAFEEKGYKLFFDSPTNQQFPILPNEVCAALEKDFSFQKWGVADEGHTIVRFCTSWATKPENVTALVERLETL